LKVWGTREDFGVRRRRRRRRIRSAGDGRGAEWGLARCIWVVPASVDPELG
jgi:hypothetical protein